MPEKPKTTSLLDFLIYSISKQ